MASRVRFVAPDPRNFRRILELSTLALACSAAGCSWSRFDAIETNPPVVILKKPSTMNAGFGVTLATASLPSRTLVVIGGADGKHSAAQFELGNGTNPTVDATDTGYCTQGPSYNPCLLGDRMAGLAVANDRAAVRESLCFVIGLGKGEGQQDYGLFARCPDTTEYSLPVPPSVLTGLIKGQILAQDTLSNLAAPLVIATDKSETPALVASSSGDPIAKGEPFAWFYKPGSATPIELVPTTKDAGFGATSAVMRLGADGAGGDAGSPAPRLIVVGAPADGHVWLFSGDSGKAVGCLGGRSGTAVEPGFGRTLATGHVDSDDLDDLVVADGTNVTVFSGAALAGLSPASDITCSLEALPPEAIIASFGCGSRDALAGCPGGFGTALDVGNLDGDGDGEVLVGAPGMTVRGTGAAGAVLVYDAEGEHPELLTNQLFLSSRQAGDALGAALVAAHITGRDVVVAGAPGSGRAAVFYCSALLGGGAGGARCQ